MYYKGSVNDPKFKKTRGYLCGAFLPKDSPLYSDKVEVAYMELNSDMKGKKHYHKEVDEFLIILKGNIKQEIDGDLLDLKPGDFVYTKAGSETELKAAGDGTIQIVIKAPSRPNDKHLC